VIDHDPEIAKLEMEIESLYSGCFSENSHEQPLYFDKGYASTIKGKLSDLVSELLSRLKDINDGSFVVVNRAEEDTEEF
jgi:hypothetical protein